MATTSPPSPRAVLLALSAALTGCGGPLASDDEDLPPVLGLSTPTAGQELDGDSVIVAGLATDDREVWRVAYRVDGESEVAVPVDPAAEVSFRFVVRGLSLGPHALDVRAADGDGRERSVRVSFSVKDATAPVVRVAAPAEDARVQSDSVRVTGTASDLRAVDSLYYRLDGGEEEPIEITPGAEVEFAFVLRPPAGEHTLVLRAVDRSGNAGETTLQFTTEAVAAGSGPGLVPLQGVRDALHGDGPTSDYPSTTSTAGSSERRS